MHSRRWWTLSVLCLSLLIVFVGNSSLNVTLPTLSRELHATRVATPVGRGQLLAGVRRAALHNRRARRPLRAQGCVAARPVVVPRSAAASLRCRPRCAELIACRARHGRRRRLIMPSTLSILVNVFPAHERPKAIAIWASVTGAAGALGPVRERLSPRALLVRFGVPRQRADHRDRVGRRVRSSCRPRRDPEEARARSRRRVALDRRHRRRSSTG